MPQQGVVGLIGGMSWESSAEYYRIINQGVRDRVPLFDTTRIHAEAAVERALLPTG